MNQQGEFRSYKNQIDTNCMHLVSIWLNVLQREADKRAAKNLLYDSCLTLKLGQKDFLTK